MDKNMVKSTPKDVFQHLLAIVTLYGSVISFIALIFQYVNYLFPDQQSLIPVSDSVRWASSALVVMFPVFVLMSWLINRDIRANPEKNEIRARKWLLYFTLFAAAITIIVDLITLLYNFFGGELTSRFGLKVFTVLVVAGAVFGYYLWELRRDGRTQSSIPKFSAWASGAVVVLAIVSGFFIIGSPSTQRALKFDQQRVWDLQNIQNQIVNYWQRKQSLPQKIQDLRDDLAGASIPVDPKTGQTYEYRPTGQLSFEICANFERFASDQKDTGARGVSSPYPYFGFGSESWNHEAGRSCFTRTIDPQLYPPIDKNIPTPVKLPM